MGCRGRFLAVRGLLGFCRCSMKATRRGGRRGSGLRLLGWLACGRFWGEAHVLFFFGFAVLAIVYRAVGLGLARQPSKVSGNGLLWEFRVGGPPKVVKRRRLSALTLSILRLLPTTRENCGQAQSALSSFNTSIYASTPRQTGSELAQTPDRPSTRIHAAASPLARRLRPRRPQTSTIQHPSITVFTFTNYTSSYP
jgi:hypothetical protein